MQATHSVPVPKIDIQSADERSSKSKQILLHTKAKFSAESRRALLGDKGKLGNMQPALMCPGCQRLLG